MQLTITLDDMQFYAYHGVLSQEQKVGNTYIISLQLELNTYTSMGNDKLSDTINYAEVYATVANEMSRSSLLLEHVVGRIARSLMLRFEMIEQISLKLSKVKPPISADIRASAVSLSLNRGELRSFLSIFADN